MKRLPAYLLLTLLAACQSHNPYQAQSQPLPPAPPAAANTFDASAYPAAPRDFSRYRSWAWRDDMPPTGSGATTVEQLREALSAALDQRGLRPARNAQPDLLVSARIQRERRTRQVYDDYGGYYGNSPWGYDRYGAYGRMPMVRTYEEEVLVVRVDLFDAKDRQPVWSGSAETPAGGDQAARAEALRNALADALQNYPPA